jgi:hypothetical protein
MEYGATGRRDCLRYIKRYISRSRCLFINNNSTFTRSLLTLKWPCEWWGSGATWPAFAPLGQCFARVCLRGSRDFGSCALHHAIFKFKTTACKTTRGHGCARFSPSLFSRPSFSLHVASLSREREANNHTLWNSMRFVRRVVRLLWASYQSLNTHVLESFCTWAATVFHMERRWTWRVFVMRHRRSIVIIMHLLYTALRVPGLE